MSDTSPKVSPVPKALTHWLHMDVERVPLPPPRSSILRDLKGMAVGQSAVVEARRMPRLYRYAKRAGIKMRVAVIPEEPGMKRVWRIA